MRRGLLRFCRFRKLSLHFGRLCRPRPAAITDLQRLTVSLRGGYEQQDGCLLFSFTGQLDAYSEKQFLAFINEHLTSTPNRW